MDEDPALETVSERVLPLTPPGLFVPEELNRTLVRSVGGRPVPMTVRRLLKRLLGGAPVELY